MSSGVSNGKAGDALEYQALGIFQAQGFVVRRSVPFRLGNGLDATDLDVYGVKFVYPFQPVTLICDCKDRVKPQAVGRVFWVKGLSACLGATDVYVISQSARLEVVHFANQNGVRVLTEEVLREYSVQSGLFSSKPFGHASIEFISPLLLQVADGTKKDSTAKTAVNDSITSFQHINAYEDFNYCMAEIRHVTRVIAALGSSDNSITTAWRYALANLVVSISVHLLYICSDSVTLNRAQRKSYILERLTFGSLQRSQTQKIVDAAFIVAQNAITDTLSDELSVRLPDPKQLFQPPAYADDVVGLVERAIAHPAMYHSLPLVMDFILFDYGLLRRKPDTREITERYGLDAAKAAKNILSYLKAHTAYVHNMLLPPQGIITFDNGEEFTGETDTANTRH